MRAVIVFLLGALLWPIGVGSAAVVQRDVALRDCAFIPDYRAINVGDKVRWTYDEGACTGLNHKVETYGNSAVSFDSSPNCPSAQSPSSDCMNRSAPLQPRQETFERTFTRQGDYEVTYYCPFHGSLSQGESQCSGMCGRIQVRGARTSPTASPKRTAAATPTAGKTASASPTPTPTGTVTATPTGTSTATPTASATATVLADDEKTDSGSGGGRALIAVAALGALGAAGFLVWRLFMARA